MFIFFYSLAMTKLVVFTDKKFEPVNAFFEKLQNKNILFRSICEAFFPSILNYIVISFFVSFIIAYLNNATESKAMLMITAYIEPKRAMPATQFLR